MQRLLMLSVSAVATIYSATAIADPSLLNGTYGFTGTGACLYASGGFSSSFQALGTTFSAFAGIEGVQTFNGDGTGTREETNMAFTLPPTVGFQPAASSSQVSASFTYTVTDDMFTVQEVPGTVVGKVLTGPRAGQTFTTEGGSMRTGLISAGGGILVTSIPTPVVETITSSNGDVQRRICTFSGVLIKLAD